MKTERTDVLSGARMFRALQVHGLLVLPSRCAGCCAGTAPRSLLACPCPAAVQDAGHGDGTGAETNTAAGSARGRVRPGHSPVLPAPLGFHISLPPKEAGDGFPAPSPPPCHGPSPSPGLYLTPGLG